MPTALDLFWDLSQPAKEQRLDASVKLVNALQLFQQSHLAQLELSTAEAQNLLSLDALNAHDVAYALRRLVRGLASPRESSRLGFAVVLTELLFHLETVTAGQMIDLVLSTSEITGSLNGQEERDMMFSRLFGLTSISQSGLITREAPLLHTSSAASTLQDYQRLITELISLGDLKSWFRESCWWSIVQIISQVSTSTATFKSQALEWTFNQLFIQTTEWTPEKVGIWLRFHSLWEPNASIPLKSVFKGRNVLSPGSLSQLAQILKDIELDEEERPKQATPGLWKASPHFVWSIIFDIYFKTNETSRKDVSPFQDFFRVVVDESIFAATSSPERKYTGFQLVELALKQAPNSSKAHLFTKNFIRTWINQLSKKDRYLHKAALKLASTVHRVVKESPSTGFPLVVQLLGPNGSRDFDRITNTKIVEIILANMSEAQIMEYVQYLVGIFQDISSDTGKTSIESNQRWVVEQFSSLIRSTTVPKSDEWVTFILNFYVRNGFFVRKEISAKQTTEISEAIRSLCRTKLSSSLAELSSQSVAQHHEAKTSKYRGRASTGNFWITEVARMMKATGEDNNLHAVFDTEDDLVLLRARAWSVIKSLNEVQGQGHEESQGALLLVSSILLQTYDAVTDDSDGTLAPALEECLENVTRMFKSVVKAKKSGKANGITKMNVDKEEFKPIDLIVDLLIGYLDKSTTLMRAVSGQVFSALCSKVEKSTIDLLIEQIQRRSVLPEVEDESMEDEEEESGHSSDASNSDDSQKSDNDDASQESDEESNQEGDVDPEFREKIAAALGAVGIKDDAESDDSEILMDDDQMMQLDDKLADIFRVQSTTSKGKVEAGLQREATHFKIRVLDLLDTFARKCPESPHVSLLIMPLIRLIMDATADEQQLIEKANGIIRKRIGIAQTLPENGIDLESLSKDLEEVHNIARKASHQKISVASLSAANVYLSRILAHNQGVDTVAKVHRDSLENFMTKKGSKINHAFMADFINRVPSAAWEIRKDFIQACASERSVNTYRQIQALQWMNYLLPHIPQVVNNQEKSLAAMRSLRETAFNCIRSAVNGTHPLSIVQVKNVAKMALHAIRITGRMDPSSVGRTWDVTECTSLLAAVQSSPTMAKDSGLMVMMRQIVTKVGGGAGNDEEAKKPLPKGKKRKADGTEVPKRKKVKWNKRYQVAA